MRTACDLEREQLVEIVQSIQGFLYLDLDACGIEYWEPDKPWSGADVCEHLAGLLHEHGLVPQHRESLDGSRYALFDLDADKLLGETVYASYPDAAEAAEGLNDVVIRQFNAPRREDCTSADADDEA